MVGLLSSYTVFIRTIFCIWMTNMNHRKDIDYTFLWLKSFEFGRGMRNERLTKYVFSILDFLWSWIFCFFTYFDSFMIIEITRYLLFYTKPCTRIVISSSRNNVRLELSILIINFCKTLPKKHCNYIFEYCFVLV